MSSIESLIKIYNQASSYFYKSSSNLNQKSIHWKRYDIRKFNSDNLKNFRNKNILSDGLDDQNDKFTFKIYADIANELSEEYILKNLPCKNIGNSDVVIPYKGVFVDYNKLIHIHWFSEIEKTIMKKNNIKNICEIGGGFGSFSELFIRNYDSRLLIIDLPEANLMCSYFLKEMFPKKSFYLFNDYKKKEFLSYSDFEENDIIILPPNCNIDPKIKIDFFINTRSMMEMNYNVIKSYFDFIHKYSREGTFFLNINRYEKISVGYPIRISEYPYDSHWEVLISKPSFNQDWIHFLLTQRNFNNLKSNILEELSRIKVISKKFYGTIYKPYDTRFFVIIKFVKKILQILFTRKLLNKISNFIKS